MARRLRTWAGDPLAVGAEGGQGLGQTGHLHPVVGLHRQRHVQGGDLEEEGEQIDAPGRLQGPVQEILEDAVGADVEGQPHPCPDVGKTDAQALLEVRPGPEIDPQAEQVAPLAQAEQVAPLGGLQMGALEALGEDRLGLRVLQQTVVEDRHQLVHPRGDDTRRRRRATSSIPKRSQ